MSSEKEFVVTHDSQKYQPLKWSGTYVRNFGDQNQGRVVSAADAKAAVDLVAKSLRLNAFYLKAEPATDKNKKGAKASEAVARDLGDLLVEARAIVGLEEGLFQRMGAAVKKGVHHAVKAVSKTGRKIKYGYRKGMTGKSCRPGEKMVFGYCRTLKQA